MPGDWKTFVLPEKAALDPSVGLAAFLRAHCTDPVRLQIQAVTAIDTRLLQYVIAASRDWKARGLDFEVAGVSPRLAAEFGRIGLTSDHLTWQGEIA